MVFFLSVTNITKLERLHRAANRTITGCFSSSPIPVLLFEASLPLLRVTLTHFILSSNERALCLPTSISDLARHGVKPRHCISSWRAFASTHPLMLPSTCSRETLLACPPFPSWNLPSFPVESTPSSSCSRSDLPFTRQAKPRYSGQTALFFFFLARAAPACLPTAFSVALRPLFPCQQAQYVQVSLLEPAPFCKLFAGLGSTNKPATSLLFSFYLTLVLSSPLCPLPHLSFYLKLCGRSGRNCFLSPLVLSGYQWIPGHLFLPGNNPADELSRLGALLTPSAIPCSLSFLISRVHSSLFADWRRTVSSEFFDTQVPSISTEELVLPRHDRCVLSRLCCNGRSLLLSSYLSRIGRIENPSCSACGHSAQDISHFILLSPAKGLFALLALWRFFVSLRPLVQTLGIWPASGSPWSSAMQPSLGRGRVTTTATTSKSITHSLYVCCQ